MSHDDKFPPNRFLKRHLTPGRLIIGTFGIIAFEFAGAKWFPQQMAMGAMYFLAVFLPVMLGLMAWNVVWWIKNPMPPRERCPECHQLKPEKDDE